MIYDLINILLWLAAIPIVAVVAGGTIWALCSIMERFNIND